MNNILVSIIMPAYNAGEFIAESIESVIKQTYIDWELIVIDDGSTDNTATIVQEYVSKEKRIRYYYQENAKLAKARNSGIEKSNGDLIAFLDSDDLWLPQKLEFCVNEFCNGDQDILFTNSYIFQKAEQLSDIESLPHMNILAQTYKGKEGLSLFLYENRVPILTAIIKRDVILSVNGFKCGFNGVEDYNLWLNLLAENFIIKGVDAKLCLYRVHKSSMSATTNLDINVIRMFVIFFRDYPNLMERYKPQIIYWISKILRQTTNIDELSEVFNKYILHQLSIRLTHFSIVYLFRYFFSFSFYKRILNKLIRNYSKTL